MRRDGALATVVAMGTRIQKVSADRRAEIASAGGAGRAAALDPETRADIARAGAAKTNGAPNLAQRIRRQWAGLSKEDRAAVREALGGCKGLLPEAPKVVKAATPRKPRTVAPAPTAEGPSES